MNIINGLNEEEVSISRKKYGKNIFTKKKQDSFIKLLLETFSDPIIKILLIALGIKVVFLFKDFDWFETIGILIAILVASLISAISEYGSMKAFNKLTEDTTKVEVKVKRNGKVMLLPTYDIVVGDIILLSEGDKIPADGKILSGSITLDESMLTGESKEVYKKENDKVFMQTTIYNGSAIMHVEKVGDNTFYGTLAKELQENNTDSPLKYRLSKLASLISKMGYIASFMVALSYMIYMVIIKNDFNITLIKETVFDLHLMLSYLLNALTLCVTIIVVSVPEGLPMMVTLVLSSNMKRMLKDNVLVRKLPGIEAAGSINVLLTDKTGTLTKGQLEVVGFLDASGEVIEYKNINHNIKLLYNMNMLINNESIYDKENNLIIGGNITDKAIKSYIKDFNITYDLIKQIPFTSENKYMYTKIKCQGKIINLVKGAYEEVIKKCNTYYDINGEIQSLKNINNITNNLKQLSSNKIRIICMAISQDKELLNNMTLLGFILLRDDIRESVPESIELVKKASIQTIMITGDNKETAVSIARELNLLEDDDIVITSSKLNEMTDEEIKKVFSKIKVIARAMPEDKSRLVTIAKELNLVVGMTGDGVNDAIALKKADVGFSMGMGSEVAKEASDIIILDNNFKSITNAILYGRTIFKSIRKFVICQLTINLCSLLVSIIGPFIGVPVPITVVQMLWINMIMDTLSGLAFSYEPALKEYMYELPKNKEDNIINKYMLNQILVIGLYSALLCIFFLKSTLINNIFGNNLMTGFFGLIIFISIFNTFCARTSRINILNNIFKNKVFIFIISFIILMQTFLIYRGGELFRTNGLSIKEFIIMLSLSLTVFPVDYIRKTIYRKNNPLGV